jgi:hypothetical protein
MQIHSVKPDQIFALSRVPGLIYILLMSAGLQASGGAVGPGIQPPPPTAYALELQKKAGSRLSADLAEVEAALTSEQLLLRLNTTDEYSQLPPSKLALEPILAKLGRNSSPRAAQIIGLLCTNEVFLAEESRAEFLLQTLPAIHPLPAQALPLLRKSLEPGSSSSEIAIRVLFDVGEKPALDIFSEEVLGGRQDPVVVKGWMRDPLLRHRTDVGVLQLSLELLQNPKFDAELKNSLVESLFDYRPKEWYVPQEIEGQLPKPPPSKNLSREARELLKKVAAVIVADSSVSATNKALVRKAIRSM